MTELFGNIILKNPKYLMHRSELIKRIEHIKVNIQINKNSLNNSKKLLI